MKICNIYSLNISKNWYRKVVRGIFSPLKKKKIQPKKATKLSVFCGFDHKTKQ